MLEMGKKISALAFSAINTGDSGYLFSSML